MRSKALTRKACAALAERVSVPAVCSEGVPLQDGEKLEVLFDLRAPDRGRAPQDPETGTYGWIRKANAEPDRAARRGISALTQHAVECRGYTLGKLHVPLKHVEALLAGTRIISPTKGDWPAVGDWPLAAWSQATRVEARKGIVLEIALERLGSGRRVVAVNAASAYHGGGGFLSGGRHALEEAICVQSTLFGSLERAARLAKASGVVPVDWARPARPAKGTGEWVPHIPDDGAVLSPLVEVFREGTSAGYAFQDAAAALEAVVSVAMPNCNDRMSDSPVDAHPEPGGYVEQLERKWRAMLAAAAFYTEADCLVVPDAGCGVFRNPPAQVGAALGRLLRGEFAGRFAEVLLGGGREFTAAVLDPDKLPESAENHPDKPPESAENHPDKLPRMETHPDKLPERAENHPDELPGIGENHPDKLPESAENHPDKLPESAENHVIETPSGELGTTRERG